MALRTRDTHFGWTIFTILQVLLGGSSLGGLIVLRTNRQFVPQALHSLTKANMRRGQITGLTTGDVDVMVWRDINRVAMISTYHGNAVKPIRETTKPILILDYNIMMGGVDKKTRCWPCTPLNEKEHRCGTKNYLDDY